MIFAFFYLVGYCINFDLFLQFEFNEKYPPAQGYNPQFYPPPQQQMYPPQMQGYPPQQQAYSQQMYPPPQQQMYPPQMQDYPPQQQMYPPQMQGYPPQQQMYLPQQQNFQVAPSSGLYPNLSGPSTVPSAPPTEIASDRPIIPPKVTLPPEVAEKSIICATPYSSQKVDETVLRRYFKFCGDITFLAIKE